MVLIVHFDFFLLVGKGEVKGEGKGRGLERGGGVEEWEKGGNGWGWLAPEGKVVLGGIAIGVWEWNL